MSKLNNTLVSKRFIIRKSLIGKNINVSFTDYDGKVHKYSHDKVYELCKERFDNMKCFKKYKYYSQTFALPKFVRELGDEVLVKQNFTPSGYGDWKSALLHEVRHRSRVQHMYSNAYSTVQ